VTKFTIPVPDLQIAFHHRLSELRDVLLLDALLAVSADADIDEMNHQLSSLAPRQALRKVAGWGLRGEVVFPIPYVLERNPYLLGYYRLLLGFSQKQFYGKLYGFGIFKSMEEKGVLTDAQKTVLGPFCRALCKSSEHLIKGIGKMTNSTVHDLALLTLGPQLRGGALNLFGTEATDRVFELIRSILAPAITSSTSKVIAIKNAAGRVVKYEIDRITRRNNPEFRDFLEHLLARVGVKD
jgi:hypothetical protein